MGKRLTGQDNKLIELDIMPNNCDVVVAKMDPRANDYALKLQSVKDQVTRVEKQPRNATIAVWNKLKTEQSYNNALMMQSQKNKQNFGIDKGNAKSYNDWVPDTKAGKFIKAEIDKGLDEKAKARHMQDDDGCVLI